MNLCNTLSTDVALPSTIFGLYFNFNDALTDALLKIEHSLKTVFGSSGSIDDPPLTPAPLPTISLLHAHSLSFLTAGVKPRAERLLMLLL